MKSEFKKNTKSVLITVLLTCILLLASCASEAVPAGSEIDVTGQNVEADQPSDKGKITADEEPVDKPGEPEIYIVDDEVYEQTFDEVDEVIRILNGLIARRSYAEWLEYLTPEYIESILEPEHLDELNKSSILQRNNITVENLEDYFVHVVVPSRSNLRLDDLVFIDDNTVQVIMFVRDRPVILYLLRRIDGEWRISV
ncbi:hypothetical protein [Spirochaeta dissipatitropha]